MEKPRPKQRPDPEPLQKTTPAPSAKLHRRKEKARDNNQSERGYFGVLTQDRTPRKIIPNRDKIPIRLVASPEEIKRWKFSDSLKLGQPYFVFEENESELLIGPVQDKELALGWVSRADMHRWDARTVLLDDTGAVRGYVNQEGDKIIDANTGSIRELDIQSKRATFFSETELFKASENITRLISLFERKKTPYRDLVKILRGFVRKNDNTDFLDLTVLKNILDELPGEGDLDFLERRKMDRYIELITMSLGPQLDNFISLSKKASNNDNATLIVPDAE